MHLVLTVAALTDWLTAIGGLLVFAATAVLALLAKLQMDAARRASAEEAAAIEKQINASVQQGREIREAARAQLQPIVFGHPDRIYSGPDDERDLSEGQYGFGYRLKNEGTGLALNIEHGVEIDGYTIAFGEGGRYRALTPGEMYPVPDFLDALGHVVHVKPFVAVADERALPEGWSSRVYWARFDNVFGERFQTRNPSDPTKPADFKRISP